MHSDAANDNARLTVAEAGFLAMIGFIGAVEVGAALWIALRAPDRNLTAPQPAPAAIPLALAKP